MLLKIIQPPSISGIVAIEELKKELQELLQIDLIFNKSIDTVNGFSFTYYTVEIPRNKLSLAVQIIEDSNIGFTLD